jgi:hypothetical protein
LPKKEERMTKLFVVGAAIAAALTLAMAPAADGYHRNALCDYNYGYYSSNQYRSLAMTATNYAYWYSDHDFIAIRVDPAGNETYRQWVPGSSAHESWTTDGYDRWRRTVIQRAGYTQAYWYMEQWSHAYCG